MTYIDAKILVETALKNGVLSYAITNLSERENPKYVAVYMTGMTNDDGSPIPDGWCAEPIEDFIHDVMDDQTGQDAIIGKLNEMGVEIKWFDWAGFDKTMAALTKIAV